MGDYNHCGTEGYGGYFGNDNWQAVDWSSLGQQKTTANTDFPPARYPDSIEAEQTAPPEPSPKQNTRDTLISVAADLGLATTVDVNTDVVKISFTTPQQPEELERTGE